MLNLFFAYPKSELTVNINYIIMGSKESKNLKVETKEIETNEIVYDYDRNMVKSIHLLEDGTYQTNHYSNNCISKIILHKHRNNIKNRTEMKFAFGKLESKYTIVNDLYCGLYELYHGGTLKESGYMNNNIKEGIICEYQSEERYYERIGYSYRCTCIKTNYLYGIQHGNKEYYLNDRLLLTEKYVYGNLVETIDHKKIEDQKKEKEAAELKEQQSLPPPEYKNIEETLPSAPPLKEEGSEQSVDISNVDQPKSFEKKQLVDA